MTSPIFDERVHLAVVGDGFLRTPFLNTTQDPPPDASVDPSICSALQPEIIHLPAAGRKSGLNLHDPAFRRVVLTSTLCQLITRERSAQANQEGAGITFGFSQSPNRNHARVSITDDVTFLGERALILDESGIAPGRPIDLNTEWVEDMTTGWLVFVSRSWQDLRHVDPGLMLTHRIPLQFDCEFNTVPFIPDGAFRAFLPIIGNVGEVRAYDSRLGPSSYDPAGSPLTSVGSPTGTVKAVQDTIGGWYLDLKVTSFLPQTLPIAITDASGQVFSKNLLVQETYHVDDCFVFLPHALLGVPYYCTLPPFPAAFNVVDLELPAGLYFDGPTRSIQGTPTEYGSNFGWHDDVIPDSGDIGRMGFYLTVNRPPRTLMTISDYSSPDYSSGEYYACQFLPFGSIMSYAGKIYEFRRHLNNGEPWPGIVEKPYSLTGGRMSAREQERVWVDLIG